MDMTGERRIPARREVVWRALNDPEVLRACIPGCQALDKVSETELTALAVVKVGPISARFQGAVTLCDLDPPNGYRIVGEGQGGVAGHARGEAVVRLDADGDETILGYEVKAQVGGKLAQLGGRMIDATARTLAASFFQSFAAEIERRESAASGAAAEPPNVSGHAPASAAAASGGSSIARPQPYRRNGGLLIAAGAAGAVLGALWCSAGRLSEVLGTPLSPDVQSVGRLLAVGAIGYLLGRRSPSTG